MSNYIDDLAADIAHLLPDCPEGLLPFYVLLTLVKGDGTTPRDVHDAWAAWKAPVEPDHRYLVPFTDLPPEIQEYDHPPAAAIWVAAERLGRT